MADLKRQRICVTFCLKLRKTVSKSKENKPGFTVTTQKPNSSSLSGKTSLLHVRRRKVRCENIRNLFLQLSWVIREASQRLKEQFRRKCRERGRNKYLVQNGNAPAHNAVPAQQLLRDVTFLRPPPSPQLPLFKRPVSFLSFRLVT